MQIIQGELHLKRMAMSITHAPLHPLNHVLNSGDLRFLEVEITCILRQHMTVHWGCFGSKLAKLSLSWSRSIQKHYKNTFPQLLLAFNQIDNSYCNNALSWFYVSIEILIKLHLWEILPLYLYTWRSHTKISRLLIRRFALLPQGTSASVVRSSSFVTKWCSRIWPGIT